MIYRILGALLFIAVGFGLIYASSLVSDPFVVPESKDHYIASMLVVASVVPIFEGAWLIVTLDSLE